MAFLRKRRDVSKEIEALFAATKDRERGSLITYDEIEEAIGIEKDAREFAYIVGKWKNRLRTECEIETITVNSVGYRLANHNEQLTSIPEKYRKSAARSIKKAARAIGSISPEKLPEEWQRQLQHETLRQLADETATAKKNMALTQSYVSNPKTLPKVPRNNLN